MPSLFEEMQEARRRGELAVPEEGQGAPEPVEVTFLASSAVPGACLCEGCWALVDHRVTDAHAEWHRRIGG